MEFKSALKRVAMWVSLALLFNIGIYVFMGQQKALEFLGGYIIEQSLSLDNLFVFLMIFSAFGISSKYQSRVLNYGIMGAIILRAIFVILGSNLVTRFEWILYIFGIILIVSGIKMFAKGEEDASNVKESKLLNAVGKVIPFTEHLEGEKFFVRIKGVLHATPLFAVLLLVEFSDIIFAIDSIPAIFSITTDVFIVYTSNIFAILGLRSLYFVLEKLNSVFKYMKYGVATILSFTGIKLGILYFGIHIPVVASISIIVSILIASIVASVIFGSSSTDEEPLA